MPFEVKKQIARKICVSGANFVWVKLGIIAVEVAFNQIQ